MAERRAPEAPVEASMDEEEDILDLTAELGGLEPVEETMEAEVVDMVEVVAEAAPTEAAAAETPPEVPEVFEPAPAPQHQAAAAPEPVPVPPPLPMSASDEAASALERAIAALRAGQLPTSFSEFSAQPGARLPDAAAARAGHRAGACGGRTRAAARVCARG